jgi:hypothetical protein
MFWQGLGRSQVSWRKRDLHLGDRASLDPQTGGGGHDTEGV